jgi:7-cyano-7-deazaguanine synthase
VKRSVCVLVSGGLDSFVLVAEMVKTYRRVYPVYIRQGLAWERDELRHLRGVTVLDFPVRDLYRNHWSVTGRRVPGAKTHDEAVYLPGRNLMLLSKAAVFCALHKIPVIAVGTLGHNPFSDATPKFFRDFARASGVKVIAPFRRLTKTQVIRRGRHLLLHQSFSCIAPKRGQHCGRCNKCAERQRAFREAGIEDRTGYARAPH